MGRAMGGRLGLYRKISLPRQPFPDRARAGDSQPALDEATAKCLPTIQRSFAAG